MSPVLKTERDGIIGAFPPPPGVIPNFKNPDSQGYRVTLAIAIMFPLATIVLLLRVYTRMVIVRNVGTDDLTHLGLGVHIWDVPFTTFSPDILRVTTISGIFNGMSFMCVKLSILVLYLRLSPYRSFRIAVWVVVTTTVLYSFLGSFQFVFNCQPIAKNWDLTITGGKCIDVTKIMMTHGSINITTDIAMLVLPIPLVRKLKLPMKQKVALAGLFMTGTLVCIVSCIRLKILTDLFRSQDFTWVGAEGAVWSVIELYVGIICACISSFKPFLRRHFPKVIGSSDHSTVVTTPFNTKTAKTLPRTLTDEYELDLCDRHRKSGIPRKTKQQTYPDNESQEDILGDGFPEGISRGKEVNITSGGGPFSQKGSF
ncbi:hypothetical protein BKA61DRAFT_493526 [Leptodontidium sp. MPI-SDFR-AT-0119]|nr:hypothetical protein BKA61DRAFT_493526 [Leptodontidium sp. MPI-SDFR-AT-0119]